MSGKFVILLWTLVWLAIGLPASVGAEQTQIGRLPQKINKAGFTMDATMDLVVGNGYQPVRLRFTPTGKVFSRDHHVQVVITPRDDWKTELDYDFHQSVTLPQGDKSFEVVCYVPNYYSWSYVQMTLLEDGIPIETGSSRFHLPQLRARSASQQISVGILEPTDMGQPDAKWKTYPDVRTLVTALGNGPIPEDAKQKRLSHKDARELALKIQPAWIQFRPIAEQELPTDWRGYTVLDVIIVAAPVLDRIAAERPKAIETLRRWIASGGNLWVYAAGQSTLSSITRSLHDAQPRQIVTPEKTADDLQLDQPNDTTELAYESWNGVYKQSQNFAYQANDILKARKDVYQQLKDSNHPFAKTLPSGEIASDVRIGSLGLGT